MRGSGGGLGRAVLSRIKERVRGLLHIGLAKERGRKQREARRIAQRTFTQQGPKSLWPKSNREAGTNADVEEVTKFWGGYGR